jgi:hypothetical protein
MCFEGEALSCVPLAIRVSKTGIAALFRYGVACVIGLSAEEEAGFLEKLTPRIGGKLARFEEETAILALASEAEDQVTARRSDTKAGLQERGSCLAPHGPPNQTRRRRKAPRQALRRH